MKWLESIPEFNAEGLNNPMVISERHWLFRNEREFRLEIWQDVRGMKVDNPVAWLNYEAIYDNEDSFKYWLRELGFIK